MWLSTILRTAIKYGNWGTSVIDGRRRLKETDYVASEANEPAWYAKSSAEWDEYSWCGRNSKNRPHDVGTKRAKVLGVHDMYGNVVEWCGDHPGYFRGVAYVWNPRPGAAFTNSPTYIAGDVGFRIARSVE